MNKFKVGDKVRVRELYPYCHCGAKMDGKDKL